MTMKNRQAGPAPTSTLSLTVQTVDKEVLFPVGTEFSQDSLNTLISSNNNNEYPCTSLMEFDTIKEDLLSFLSVPPYQSIFSINKVIDDILEEMASVNLPAPILKSFNYFKEHDNYSYRHFLVVFALSTLLARNLIGNRNDRMDLAGTGPIHDIGKICIPPDILLKTTPLSRKERTIMNDHTTAGYILLGYYFGDAQTLACSVARDHHERMDGSGYPSGIRLNDVMIEVVVVCDIYDALISQRPYRQVSYDNRSALELISNLAEQGTLSMNVVKALISQNREAKPYYTEVTLPKIKRGVEPPGNLYGVIIEDD